MRLVAYAAFTMVKHDSEPAPTGSLRRVTINDIATRAGVSTAAVSYALNDRPGVGLDTRVKIKQIATTMGWRPNHAARSLQAARVNAIGMVLQRARRPHEELSSFMLRFLDGVNSRLSEHGDMLLLHAVHDSESEQAVYQQWFAERRVDAVVLVNPTVDDPRLPLIERLGLPAVVAGDTRGRSVIPAVWTDDADALALAVSHLVGLAHRRIAWVGGQPNLIHSHIRHTAFTQTMQARGLAADLNFEPADDVAETALLTMLLHRPDPPSAIIYEHHISALRALNELRVRGVDVPTDMSLMTWDDDPICRLTTPTLTSLRRDAFDYGQVVGGHLLTLLAGGPVGNLCGARSAAIARQSTAVANPRRPPGAAAS